VVVVATRSGTMQPLLGHPVAPFYSTTTHPQTQLQRREAARGFTDTWLKLEKFVGLHSPHTYLDGDIPEHDKTNTRSP
jgi:hypothetical protein